MGGGRSRSAPPVFSPLLLPLPAWTPRQRRRQFSSPSTTCHAFSAPRQHIRTPLLLPRSESPSINVRARTLDGRRSRTSQHRCSPSVDDYEPPIPCFADPPPTPGRDAACLILTFRPGTGQVEGCSPSGFRGRWGYGSFTAGRRDGEGTRRSGGRGEQAGVPVPLR